MSYTLKEDISIDFRPDLKETDKPFISVIIPTYNRLPLLLEAIESVRTQSYTNWEMIIVDDGSTDGTAAAIQKIKDQRISLIQVSHIGNIGSVRNIGAAASKGEWLAFLDSDDLWLSKKIELQMQLLLRENRLWAYTGSEIIDKSRRPINKRAGENQVYSGWIIKEILNTQTDFTISSMIIQRNIFYAAGGFSEDPKLFCREDHEFTLRLALKAEASAIPEVLVKIREHSGRTTNQLDESFERSAAVYTAFLQYASDKTLKKIATKRKAYHLSEASVYRFFRKNYKTGMKQLIWSFTNGDNKRHWLSVVKRCIYALIKKNSSHTAKKGKTKISDAYTA